MPQARHLTLVAPQPHPKLSAVIETMESQGYEWTRATRVNDLLRHLNGAPKTAVVVYNRRGDDTAEQVLAELRTRKRKNPVIVVVDRGDFSHYYELMCRGAYDYFELPEGPEVIAGRRSLGGTNATGLALMLFT